MSNRSGRITEGTPIRRSATSPLSNRSFFLRAWFSYAIIGASCAVGLAFVILAQSVHPDISAADALQTGSHSETMLKQAPDALSHSTAELMESAASEAPVFEIPDLNHVESTPIRQAAPERRVESTQPTRVELTSGGDFRSDSPVRLLGEIHLLEEDGRLLETISPSSLPSTELKVDLLELTPVDVSEPQTEDAPILPPLFP